MKRTLAPLVAGLMVVAVLPFAAHGDDTVVTPASTLRAGVSVVDATWHVGAPAGQYANTMDPQSLPQQFWDPQVQHLTKQSAYGFNARFSVRALVVEGREHQRIALVKTDNYLSQDYLARRVAQLLDKNATSKVTYANLMISASHDHSSPYYVTPSAGVWLFQDAFDLRMFEFQARAIAQAIEQAAASMKPARMGATTIDSPDTQGNVVGPQIGDDGSPAGYPLSENVHGVVVMRFDDLTNPQVPKPLATWVNYAEHPESLDGYNVASPDYLASFQRHVDADTGAPMVFSQGAVGSSEGPYIRAGQNPTLPDGTIKAWAHAGFAQAERQGALLAQKVLTAWQEIGAGGGQVPYGSDLNVVMTTRWTPGPLSHPYPSVSNCRTQPSLDGNPGLPVVGLPDCARAGAPTLINPHLYDTLTNLGVPLPANYDVTSFGTVEENLRIKLQVVRLGEVLLASCSCEPQVDLIKNLQTRLDTVQGNEYLGYDYSPTCHPTAAGYDCADPRNSTGVLHITKAAYDRMRAEVFNDAAGWDDPSYVPYANSEPTNPALIKGNFTHSENPAKYGFTLVVGLGHTGDYDGYTVSYREYQNRDSYRKALTTYGPHTADYMVTKLQAMAAALKGGPALAAEPDAALGTADELRQTTEAKALGVLSSLYYDAYFTTLPNDVGVPQIVDQPVDVTRFQAATVTWRGGSNYTDTPYVRVERLVDGIWVPAGDQRLEVQTMVHPPSDATALVTYRLRKLDWKWTATFEAFDAFPRNLISGGQVANGTYRFVLDGTMRKSGALTPYHLVTRTFSVNPWAGIVASDLRRDAGGAVSFLIDPIHYPRTYTSPFSFIRDDGGTLICRTCSFRPWASTSEVSSAVVTVTSATTGATLRTVPAVLVNGRWSADTALQIGEAATVLAGSVRDGYGETNGAASRSVVG